MTECKQLSLTVSTNVVHTWFPRSHFYKKIIESKIIPPCYIGAGSTIENSTIGPNVSIGVNTKIKNSNISSAIVQDNSNLENADINNSMIGNYVWFNGNNIKQEVSIGDFCEIK